MVVHHHTGCLVLGVESRNCVPQTAPVQPCFWVLWDRVSLCPQTGLELLAVLPRLPAGAALKEDGTSALCLLVLSQALRMQDRQTDTGRVGGQTG